MTLGFGGWDTHSGNFGLLRNRLLPPLDKAISTLIRDLASRGLLDETIVVCAGEFGGPRRSTARLGAATGRVRWPCSWPAAGSPVESPTGPRTTAGRRRRATPAPRRPRRHPLPAAGFGPRHEVRSTGGRPIPIFREGRCLEALVG